MAKKKNNPTNNPPERRELEELDQDLLEIRVNLDDMHPEHYQHVMDRLFAAGARDVFLTPIIMKKGRPGILLTLLAKSADLAQVEEVIFAETTSLGLRYQLVTCHRLERSWETCPTPWGPVRVKKGYHQGKRVQFAPEHEDCLQAAQAGQVPLKDVYDLVRAWVLGQEA